MKFISVTGLILMLVLSACGGPSSSRDMYVGKNQQNLEKGPSQVTTSQEEVVIDAARLAALQEYGIQSAIDPDKLIGFKTLQLKRVLGEPAFVRRDQGVEVWQYQNAECILDLFLYENTQGVMQVDHTELRGPRLNTPYSPKCFSNLLMGLS